MQFINESMTNMSISSPPISVISSYIWLITNISNLAAITCEQHLWRKFSETYLFCHAATCEISCSVAACRFSFNDENYLRCIFIHYINLYFLKSFIFVIYYWLKSLWFNDAIWRFRAWLSLAHAMDCLSPVWRQSLPGVGVTKPISSVPLLSDIFDIVKSHITYWISCLYLAGVAAAQLRRYLPNMNVIQRT